MMNKRILFSACVLAACFTACTNDDFEAERTNNVVIDEAGEVIGANLVSNGLSMNLNEGGASTRVDADGNWEAGKDMSGLAWYKYSAGTDITAEQIKKDWYSATGDNNPEDQNLYANHLLTYQANGKWTTQGDIYQGAYFAYYPFDRLPKDNKKKVIEPNAAVQDQDFETEWKNKALVISAQDFISQESVDENFEMNEPFVLAPMVNVLGVTATPTGTITKVPFLQKMIITKMQINAGGNNNNIFTTKGTLVPGRLPRAIDNKGKRKEDKDIWDELDKVVANSTASSNALLAQSDRTISSSLITNVDKNAGFNLTKDNKLRAFAFPLATGATYSESQYPGVQITVSSPNGDWAFGYFNIKHNAKADTKSTNEKLVGNLKILFDKDNTEYPDFTWVKNIYGEPNEWKRIGLDAELSLNDFTLTTTGIKNQDQWNDYVDLIDALDEAEYTFTKEPVFALGTNVYFTGKIRVPKKQAIKLSTGNYALHIAGDMEWPAKLVTTDATYKSNIVVDKDVTLTFDPATRATIDVTSLVNEGTIMAGANAAISTKTAKALDNSNGRVIVEYGAYVYLNDSKDEGTVAYIVTDGKDSSKEINDINILVNGGKEEQASVNTLIIPEGVELDLNAKGADDPTEDPYNGSTHNALPMPELDGVDIELEGGSVVNSLNPNGNKNVLNVISVKGGTIRDIEPLGNITVEAGDMYVKTDTKVYTTGKDLIMPAATQIEVLGGTLYANTDVWVNKVILEKGSILTENNSYFYIPSEDCLIKTPGTNFTPGLKYTNGATATTVKNSFELLQNNSSAKDAFGGGVEKFLSTLNDYVKSNYDATETGNSYVGFYNDFSKWLVSIDHAALDGKTDITKDDMELFEKLTGYKFDYTSKAS